MLYTLLISESVIPSSFIRLVLMSKISALLPMSTLFDNMIVDLAYMPARILVGPIAYALKSIPSIAHTTVVSVDDSLGDRARLGTAS